MRPERSVLLIVLLAACAMRETPFVLDDPGQGESGAERAKSIGTDAIRIGALFAFESRSSLTENNTFSGIELAVRDANAAGGVGGRAIEVVKFSFDGTAPSAELAAKKAVESGVSAIIGPSWSNPALKAAPVLDGARVPMIVTLASHPDVTRGRPFVFRIVADDVAQARALATFTRDDLGATEYATFVDLADASSLSAASRFADAMGALGGREVRRAEYRSEGSDEAVAASWKALLKGRAAPVAYLPTKVRDTARVMRIGRAQGFSGTFVGGDGWGNLELMVIAGKASRGAAFVSHWNPDVDAEGSVDFLERYLAAHRVEPTIGAAAGYDAARALVLAMIAAGGDDREKVRNALAAGTFPCTTGSLEFDAERTARRPLLVLKVGISRFATHRLVAPPALAGAAP